MLRARPMTSIATWFTAALAVILARYLLAEFDRARIPPAPDAVWILIGLAATLIVTIGWASDFVRLLDQYTDELEDLNRELAAASRFKTQFVAQMSHELRTPLNAIVGAAELLCPHSFPSAARTFVAAISQASEALLGVVSNILDFSKIEAGKLELVVADFRLDAIVDGAAEVVAQQAFEKGIRLHTYVDPAIAVTVHGDPDRLRQVLLNLVGNALKFTTRGSIVIRAVPVQSLADRLVVQFEVHDTGSGDERCGPRAPLRAVRPRRSTRAPARVRNRAGAVDLAPARRADGRRDRGLRARSASDRRSALRRASRNRRCPTTAPSPGSSRSSFLPTKRSWRSSRAT